MLAALLAMPINRTAAEEPTACSQFSWNLSRERAWFATNLGPALQSGANVLTLPSTAVVLELKPADAVAFSLPPGGKTKPPNTFAGTIAFANISVPGIYQITLSDDGWIDVIQNHRALTAEAHTGKRDCPGVRKSVRFSLEEGSATIQLSGVPSSSIKMAILPAVD